MTAGGSSRYLCRSRGAAGGGAAGGVLLVRDPRTAATVAVAHGEALIVQPVALQGVSCHLLAWQRQLAAVAAEDLQPQ